MNDKIYSIDEIKTKLRELLSETEVLEVVLFGSYAKNEATINSDIDLVIDTNEKLMGLKLFSLISKIENALEKDIDAFEKAEIIEGSKIEEEIKKYGIVIYEK